MFYIFFFINFAAGIFAESSNENLKTYDYTGNYGGYSHGRSDESEPLVSGQVLSSGGFSPSDGRYTSAASHDSIERVTSYLSTPHSSTPAYGTKFKNGPSSSSQQSSASLEGLSGYKSSYTSTSPSTSHSYSSPPTTYSYIPISGNNNQVEYSSAGFPGNAQGNYENYAKSYTSQGTNRGSSVDEYLGSLKSSSPGYTPEGPIGSGFAGYEVSASSPRVHTNNYAAASANGHVASAIPHEYSVNEPEVSIPFQSSPPDTTSRYPLPIYSSEITYKDPDTSTYNGMKSSYPIGNHLSSYSSPPNYIRYSESHPSAHYSHPGPTYSMKTQGPTYIMSNHPGGPGKIIVVREAVAYPGSYSAGNYKSRVYGVHFPSYPNSPGNSMTGYLSKAFVPSNNSPYSIYP